MFGFSPAIQLTDLGPRDGMLHGQWGRYCWEARLTRGPVSYGIDPRTLYKGAGRVARLVLYERVSGTDLLRKVAVFDRGWQFGRREHLGAVRRVVGYLDR